MSLDAADLTQILAELQSGQTPVVWSAAGGGLLLQSPEPPRGILSGSFNPLHAGHIALRRSAEAALDGAVYFELTLRNVDKPLLDSRSLAGRLVELQSHPLVLTNAPTFAEKARLFPGTTFVVGLDTAQRILEVRFYDGCAERMAASLESVREAGCRFLVAGRSSAAEFKTLGHLVVPADFVDLFCELPEDDFRVDVSSTEMRDGG